MTRSRAPASARVRAEWARRVQAEYGSAAIAQELGLWVIQIGGSPDLVRMCNRAAADELAHAAAARRVLVAAGGEGAVVMDRERLGLPRRAADALELDVARACVEVFCLGETVAVPLFAALRSGCTVPVARAALDRVLRDEVRHRDLGWVMLGWLLELPIAGALRALLERELPAMFARLRRSYAPVLGPDAEEIAAADRTWGLMAPARYGAVLARSVGRDHLPRFEALGVDARAAWASACASA